MIEDEETKEPFAYALAHDAKVALWQRTKKLTTIPPRLSHVFVKKEHRKRGFGTALLTRWIEQHAADAKYFAVDTPNAKMLKLLGHTSCERAVEKSGFQASNVHFLNLPI